MKIETFVLSILLFVAGMSLVPGETNTPPIIVWSCQGDGTLETGCIPAQIVIDKKYIKAMTEYEKAWVFDVKEIE